MQRSRALSIGTLCALALGTSCSRADTRPAAPDARIELAAEAFTAEDTPTTGSAREPPEVGTSAEPTGSIEGAAPGSSNPMPVLNQLLTTQALLISLLLAPLAKEPHELPPSAMEPALPATKSGNASAPDPAPPVRKRMIDLGALHASG